VRFGILQRYVSGEVFRSFIMALLTITIVFVLFIVMTEATRMGLSPREILGLIPFVIPGSLPYTVPVSMLFAVTVVYGRLAGDNEIIAIKTAGQSAWIVLWPSISLGLAISVALLVGSRTAIPRANSMAKKAIIKTYEDGFYKFLKRDRELSNGAWEFVIKVEDVDVPKKELIGAWIKHRAAKPNPAVPRLPGDEGEAAYFDMIIWAEKARIRFDIEHDVAHVYLDKSDIRGNKDGTYFINDSEFEFPLPADLKKMVRKPLQEMTASDLDAKEAEYIDLIALERKRQAFAAALKIAAGRVEWVDWKGMQAAFGDYAFWNSECKSFETERQMRTAMACGTFFFVFLGGPIGIRFARRDFLSAFITCFVPIIVLYYPLMLGGVNLGKSGIISPVIALWSGNVLLFVLATLVLRPVLRH
jgi:lipopolysaccharide export system permease protein